MPLVRMNVPCNIAPKLGANDYGQGVYGTPIPAMCAVIKLQVESAHTTVRTDSGATRGHAKELIASSVLLFPKKSEPTIGSRVVLRTVKLVVVSVRTRYDVFGRIDHFEVGCAIE